MSATIADTSCMQVGQALPALQLSPVNRQTLALFAGASGDHNPIHIDLDFARQAGSPDVFAHGMLGMAWVGRLLTMWVPQHRLLRLDVRFQGITQLGDALQCTGQVVELLEYGGEHRVRVELRSANQHGQTRIVGEALLACSPAVSPVCSTGCLPHGVPT